MKEVTRDIVSALIFSKDGKLFQGKKDPSKGGVYIDCWHIPGGGIENGEDKIDALKREILEETGIDVSTYKIELVDDIGKGESEKTNPVSGEIFLCKMNFFVYRVDINDKLASEIQVSLDDDLVEYQWTDVSEVKNLHLTPPSIELFKRLALI